MSPRLSARTVGWWNVRLWQLAVLAIVTVVGEIGCGGGSAEPLPVRQMLERVKARAVQKEGRFETLSFRQSKLTDDDLLVVHGLSRLRVLELYGTDTTDRGVAALRDLPSLEGLGLSKTRITDDGLAGLDRFPKLRTLYLIDTAISDAGLAHLHQLKSLEVVDASGTRVTAEGIGRLRTALPRCDVKWTAPKTDRPASPLEESSNVAVVPPTPTGPVRREPPVSGTVRPPANVVPPARPADIEANLELSWVTPDGAGGVVLPRLSDWHGPSENTNSRFRRLVGILMDDDESEIIFLGVDEPNWPLMSAEDLLDGLAVAVESLKVGHPPGVTFEPMAESLARPPKDQDPLRVEYFGAAANTVVGRASFEADRMMKCLSAGKDNLTGLPVRSAVAGRRSELDLVLESPRGKSAAWHRFWIEPTEGSVRNYLDGRLLLAELQLAVQTRFQIVRNGKLVDAPQQADPAAKAFAGLLTSRYREFAGEQPSFAMTHNFAVLTSLAGAILDPSSTRRWERFVEHVAEHRPRSVETPDRTPSMVVRAERTTGTATHTAQIAGGVVLRPVKMRADDSPELRQLRQQVLAARPATKGHAVWTVNDATRPIEAVSANWRRRRHVWQTDCRSGALQLVRTVRNLYCLARK